MDRPLSIFVSLARPYNSVLPILLVYVGSVMAGASYTVTLTAMMIILLLHSIVTLHNDVEDVEVDASNHRDVSWYKTISPREVTMAIYVIAAVSLLVSIVALPSATTGFVALLMILSWAYNAHPLRLSRRPLGSIIVLGICYGFAPFMIGVSLDSSVTIADVLFGASVAFGRISLSILKDYKDAHGDALHQKKTFLLVYGRSNVRYLSIFFSALGYAGVIGCLWWYSNSPPLYWVLVGIVIAGWLVTQRIRLHPRRTYDELNYQFHQCLHYELVFYGYIVLWLTTFSV